MLFDISKLFFFVWALAFTTVKTNKTTINLKYFIFLYFPHLVSPDSVFLSRLRGFMAPDRIPSRPMDYTTPHVLLSAIRL